MQVPELYHGFQDRAGTDDPLEYRGKHENFYFSTKK